MRGTVASLRLPGPNWSSAVESDASDNIDVISVKEAIARSKELIASVTEELNQHNLWFKSYLDSERRNRERHARWLNRQEAIRRRQLKRQRMVQSFGRVALACLFFVRSVARLLVQGVISALFYLRHWFWVSASWTYFEVRFIALSLLRLISVTSRWLAVKARFVAFALLRAASTAFSWIAVKTRALTLLLLSRLSVGLSWIRVNGHAFALSFLRAASTAFSRIAAKTRALTLLLLSRLPVIWSWIRVNSQALALAFLKAASTAFSWIAVRSRALRLSLLSRLPVIWSWIRVNGHAFALAFLRAASTAFSRIAAKTRALTLLLLSRLSVGLSWIRVNSHAFTLAFLKAASNAFYWIAVKTRALRLSLLSRFSVSLSWIGVRARAAFALSLASMTSPWSRIDNLKRSSLTKLRLAQTPRERGLHFWRRLRATGIPSQVGAEPQGEGNELRSEGRVESKVAASFRHDEPKAKQSTALVCIEPWRNRLPIVKQAELMGRL